MRLSPINYNFQKNITFQGVPDKAANITKETLQKLLSEQKSPIEISKILNCDISIVSQKINEYGLLTKELFTKRLVSPIEVQKYLQEGLSCVDIAKKLGCSRATVMKLKSNWDLKSLQKRPEYKNEIVNQSVDEIKKQLANGASIGYLAKLYESSATSVRNFLAKHGLATKESVKISKISKELIEKLLSQGKTQSDIAKIFDVNPGAISGLFHKYKIKSPEIANFENISKEQLIELYERTRSVSTIAECFNVSVQSVNKLFYKFGLKEKRKAEVVVPKNIPSKDELKELVENGATFKSLNEKYGFGTTKLANILDEYGLKLINSRESKNIQKHKQVQDIKVLVAQRKSPKEIAQELGISKDVLIDRLNEFGIATLEKTKSLTSIKPLEDMVNKGMSVDEMAKFLQEEPEILDEIIANAHIKVFHPEKFTCVEPWDEQWLLQTLVKRGSSPVQIGELYGVSTQTAKKWLKDLQMPILEDKLSPTKEEFQKLLESILDKKYQKNMPIEWSKETGFSKHTIKYLADKYGMNTLFYKVEHGV